MITVGITGGIGSGKTTVANIWKKMGARVIYADDLAKEIMGTDHSVKQQLIKTFGNESYTRDGDLNKPHLIKEAFQKNRVDELNAIVHPVIRRKIESLIGSAKNNDVKLFVYEAAILLNEGRPDYLDVVVIVTGQKSTRLKRVAKRDRVSNEAVIERMAKQPDFDTLTHLADYTIENNGTLKELEQKAIELYRVLIGNH
ncbi:dephospho-CoA kinase [soil metagenome]